MWSPIHPHVYPLILSYVLTPQLQIHEVNAYACRVELPDENCELVPESERELAEGEVNVVEVQQDLH